MSPDHSPPPATALSPPDAKTRPVRSSCLTSAFAFLALAGSATMLVMIPGFIGAAIVLGGMAFIGLLAFHYFVWGRWLSRELQASEQEEDDSRK